QQLPNTPPPEFERKIAPYNQFFIDRQAMLFQRVEITPETLVENIDIAVLVDMHNAAVSCTDEVLGSHKTAPIIIDGYGWHIQACGHAIEKGQRDIAVLDFRKSTVIFRFERNGRDDAIYTGTKERVNPAAFLLDRLLRLVQQYGVAIFVDHPLNAMHHRAEEADV